MHVMKALGRPSALAVVVVALVAGAANASSIGSGANDSLTGFGKPSTATYGQTFVAPLDSILTSFSIAVDAPSSGTLHFGGYVGGWDDATSKATSILFGSDERTMTNSAGVTFNTGGVLLTPGQKYVLFLSISNFFAQSSPVVTTVPINSPDDPSVDGYVPGNFVFQDNGGDSTKWTSQAWGQNPDYDLKFTADFLTVLTNADPVSVVPVPLAAFAGVGLLSAMAAKRRLSRA